MSDNNWVKICESKDAFLAQLWMERLKAAGIPAVLLNKMDGAFLNFGSVELMVPDRLQKQALDCLREEIDETTLDKD